MGEPLDEPGEAAAMWGLAENRAFTDNQRLQCALKALEFYGNAWIKEHEDAVD